MGSRGQENITLLGLLNNGKTISLFNIKNESPLIPVKYLSFQPHPFPCIPSQEVSQGTPWESCIVLPTLHAHSSLLTQLLCPQAPTQNVPVKANNVLHASKF